MSFAVRVKWKWKREEWERYERRLSQPTYSKFLEANWFLIKYQIHEIVEQIEDWTLCRQLEHTVKSSMNGAERRDIFSTQWCFLLSLIYVVQALSAQIASWMPHTHTHTHTRRRNRGTRDITYAEVKLVAVCWRHKLHMFRHTMLWQIDAGKKFHYNFMFLFWRK